MSLQVRTHVTSTGRFVADISEVDYNVFRGLIRSLSNALIAACFRVMKLRIAAIVLTCLNFTWVYPGTWHSDDQIHEVCGRR